VIPTLLGLLFFGLGFTVFLTGTRQDMFAYVLGMALFNGSASLVLTALGNTSVQPAIVAIGLMALRCLAPDRRSPRLFAASVSAHGWLLLFVAYSFVGAYTLPFLFEGAVNVVALRPTGSPTGLETHALHFSPQNVTTSVYLLATLLAALCAWVVAAEVGAAMRIARLASQVALAHAAIGWLAMAAQGTALAAVTGWLRNGIYMQLDQSFGAYSRITGVSPEPSLYVSFGFAWFVFAAELWLRDLDRRWSGPAALAMFVTLLASTSTTAYVGLAGYGVVVLARIAYFAGAVPARKALALIGCALALMALGLALAAGSEPFVDWAARMLRLTTTGKLQTMSGVARLFWARQGWDMFRASAGLGIGVGSFRSSSIVTAILGSSGVIGAAAFLFHFARVFRPFEAATWRATGEPMIDVAKAASWTALVMMIPAAVSAPSPDPGLLWGLIAGSALGLRRAAALVMPEPGAAARRRANTSISAQSGAAQGRRADYGFFR